MVEPRTGRRRALPFGLLPALALLLGALGLFAAAPAAAQTWSAMLTVKAPDGDRGCFATTGDHACTTALDDDDFTVGDTEYDVYGLIGSRRLPRPPVIDTGDQGRYDPARGVGRFRPERCGAMVVLHPRQAPPRFGVRATRAACHVPVVRVGRRVGLAG